MEGTSNATKLAVGIDIGGTNTVFGLVDALGNMHGEGAISVAYTQLTLPTKRIV